jgi:hypothetical protein
VLPFSGWQPPSQAWRLARFARLQKALPPSTAPLPFPPFLFHSASPLLLDSGTALISVGSLNGLYFFCGCLSEEDP